MKQEHEHNFEDAEVDHVNLVVPVHWGGSPYHMIRFAKEDILRCKCGTWQLKASGGTTPA